MVKVRMKVDLRMLDLRRRRISFSGAAGKRLKSDLGLSRPLQCVSLDNLIEVDRVGNGEKE